MTYTKDNLTIKAQDFGVGFDEDEIEKGSGLINMKSRAKLIDTQFSLLSKKDKGVILTLVYPIKILKT